VIENLAGPARSGPNEAGDVLHEIEGVEREAARVSARPDPDPGIPVLVQVTVTPEDDAPGAPETYAARLREVLASVCALAVREDFGENEVPVGTLPSWFVEISAPATGTISAPPPVFATEGSRSYTRRTGGGPWRIQDWLSRFDPELEARSWEFWDVTRASDDRSRLHVWLDTWGEPFFSWEELRWLLHTCGATTVSDPMVTDTGVWARENSV
jgi:hypothetical protein